MEATMNGNLSRYVTSHKTYTDPSYYKQEKNAVSLYIWLAQLRYEIEVWPRAGKEPYAGRATRTLQDLQDEEAKVAALFDAAEDDVRAHVFHVKHHACPFTQGAQRALPIRTFHSTLIERAWACEPLTDEEWDVITQLAVEGRGVYRSGGWAWHLRGLPSMQAFMVQEEEGWGWHIFHAPSLKFLKRYYRKIGEKAIQALPFDKKDIVSL